MNKIWMLCINLGCISVFGATQMTPDATKSSPLHTGSVTQVQLAGSPKDILRARFEEHARAVAAGLAGIRPAPRPINQG
jgi:hypothetical protein